MQDDPRIQKTVASFLDVGTWMFNNAITKIDPNGVQSTFANSGLNKPRGLAFDSDGNLYAANGKSNTIERLVDKFDITKTL